MSTSAHRDRVGLQNSAVPSGQLVQAAGSYSLTHYFYVCQAAVGALVVGVMEAVRAR
jgi:hypothetical protein